MRLSERKACDANHATRSALHAKHGGVVVGEIPALGVQVVQVPSGKVMEKIAAYRGEKAVELAEPDYQAKAFFFAWRGRATETAGPMSVPGLFGGRLAGQMCQPRTGRSGLESAESKQARPLPAKTGTSACVAR
ncbi:MAG: S8 family serine peptidase [Desulfotomaculales bacterium]